MKQKFSPENLRHILDGLKDFQRQTVEYVFDRLYTSPDPTHRFLIADEVGLGKTLIARGVIARTLEHLWDKVDRLDIVYICSNADIARQNINRLNLTGQSDFALASRITLLPTQIQDLKSNRVNFISFTPSTSFDLKSGMGRGEERVLLYQLLQQAWKFNNAAALNILQGDMRSDRFRNQVHYFDPKAIEPTLAGKFIADLENHPDLRENFDELCGIYKRTDSIISSADRWKRTSWIGKVRDLLARSCLTALEPDLIIMDEFQRFKHLLNSDNADSELAQHLFNYSTEHDAARVILLSATPYKMYTQAHEEDDNHYHDFIQTLKFLFNDVKQTERLEELISEYRQEVFRLGDGDITALRKVKEDMEKALKRVMVRTERLAASNNRDGMLKQILPSSIPLKADDLNTYLGLAKISKTLDQPSPLEYWKSVPYLFNFMEDYQFKADFKKSLEDPGQNEVHSKTLQEHPQLLLSFKDIEGYSELDPGNARMRSLLVDTIGTGAWRALWLPPAIPYHQLEGVFADPTLTNFTKRLVFSAWRVVPKAISVFLSYETERLMFQSFDTKAMNTAKARTSRRPLLRFSQSEGRLTGLPILGLIYPSPTLSQSIDPLRLSAQLSNGALPTLDAIIAQAEKKIISLLKTLQVDVLNSGNEDERWYWAAPMLIDATKFPKFTQEWWQLNSQESDIADEWAGFDLDAYEDTDSENESTHWKKHIEEAQNLLRDFFAKKLQLGRPPADLARVLAQMSIAGLGVISLRSMFRVIGKPRLSELISIVVEAAKVAKSFLFLFNLPENTAFIRSLNPAGPYWRRTLEYCSAGCLQSVMDEYVHVLHESLGLQDGDPQFTAASLSDHICAVLTYRTSTPSIDNIQPGFPVTISSYGMRARFAMRFGDEKNDGGIEPTRADRIRSAFNSPFWPFVLATTSIGQEGLDFHNYCHAVVHWNLPTNPVDLEQREGRVHRYKGHAVRKNLAHSYTLPQLASQMGTETDLWKVLFQSARTDRKENTNDLSPFWVYSIEGGAKIERHVPLLPLSRDQLDLEALQRSLTIYRMVFGQNRQEDLLMYLSKNFSPDTLIKLMDELRIDLSPIM